LTKLIHLEVNIDKTSVNLKKFILFRKEIILARMKDLSAIVVRNLKTLRQENNLTIEQFGHKIGFTSYAGYHKIETGKTDIKLKLLQQTSEVFKVSIWDLLKDGETAETNLAEKLELATERKKDLEVQLKQARFHIRGLMFFLKRLYDIIITEFKGIAKNKITVQDIDEKWEKQSMEAAFFPEEAEHGIIEKNRQKGFINEMGLTGDTLAHSLTIAGSMFGNYYLNYLSEHPEEMIDPDSLDSKK